MILLLSRAKRIPFFLCKKFSSRALNFLNTRFTFPGEEADPIQDYPWRLRDVLQVCEMVIATSSWETRGVNDKLTSSLIRRFLILLYVSTTRRCSSVLSHYVSPLLNTLEHFKLWSSVTMLNGCSSVWNLSYLPCWSSRPIRFNTEDFWWTSRS
jgi:hypothetical protein